MKLDSRFRVADVLVAATLSGAQSRGVLVEQDAPAVRPRKSGSLVGGPASLAPGRPRTSCALGMLQS